MKKKGFTLVELLAVIAILAILVIIALPNVLGMFNSAKSSSFVIEVQNVIRQANAQFMTEALTAQGQEIAFASNKGAVVTEEGKTFKQLDLTGNEKSYKVITDRNGNITSIIVVDNNFCYQKAGASIHEADVKVADVHEVAGETYASTSCTGTVAAN